MRALTCSIIIVLTLFAHSYAETTPDKTSAIQETFSLMGIDKQMTGGFDAMLPIVDQLASQLQLDAKGKEELKTIYRDWWENDIDRKAMKEMMVELYAKTFTTAEINELNEFYRSPVGQKFLEKAPELMKLGAEIGMKEAQTKQTKLMERLQPFLDKHKK
jgi:hypothetical protein